jgi:hypothetical protein
MFEEGAGNIPQGIALDDQVLIGRVGAEAAMRAGGGWSGLDRSGQGRHNHGGSSAERERADHACAKIFHQRVRKVRHKHGSNTTELQAVPLSG